MKKIFETVASTVSSKMFLWIVGLALVAGGTLVVISKNRDNKLVDVGREAGEAGAVVRGQDRTFGQLGDANNVETIIQRGGERNAVRHAQCLQDNQNPKSCERFRPIIE